jgi:hypothetical protein
MIATPFRSHPAAAASAAVAVIGAVAAMACATAADATVSDTPCDTSHQLAKKELRATVNGRDALIGKLYVFDEGKNLCAVTTSAGTLWDGQKKYMQVTLSVGGKVQTDKGNFGRYAGRIRLPDSGECFMANGSVKLSTGPDADAYADCPSWRRRHLPR